MPLICAFVLLSCEKETESELHSKSKTEVLAEITSLSESYIAVNTNEDLNESGYSIRRTPWWKRALRVVYADAVGGGLGSIWGPVGAIIGGGAASIGAAVSYESTLPDYNKIGVDSDFLYNANPYDFYGVQHYEVIDNAFLLKDLIVLDNSSNMYESFYKQSEIYMSANKMINQSFDIVLPFGTYMDIYKTELKKDEQTTDAHLETLFKNKISNEGLEIIQQYMKSLEISQDAIGFKDYSINVEKTLIASTAFGNEEKEVILSMMSITRIGLDYWDRQGAN